MEIVLGKNERLGHKRQRLVILHDPPRCDKLRINLLAALLFGGYAWKNLIGGLADYRSARRFLAITKPFTTLGLARFIQVPIG
jgi:hypothetical protein